MGPNADARGVDKDTSPPSNEGEAQTTAGMPPPGIASNEGADVVTASEARKVARRLVCAANEIDRLSEHDEREAAEQAASFLIGGGWDPDTRR